MTIDGNLKTENSETNVYCTTAVS